MVGKDPHRIQGKTGAAEWDRRGTDNKMENDKRVRDVIPPEKQPPAPAPSRFVANEQVGGSRPGVRSRVKDAIADREEE